jgi:hypothetical protein
MVLLHLLVLCDLCLSFLLTVFPFVLWLLGIGRQGFSILAEWSILEAMGCTGFFLILAGLISGFNIMV